MKKHIAIIKEVLGELNAIENNPFVLKGGTALMECYGLDRQSEDIDLDCPGVSYEKYQNTLFDIVDTFSSKNGFDVRVAKRTPTVQRTMLHYGSEKPLKIELSFRRLEIPENKTVVINNIKTYVIDELCQMKLSAYLSRDTIRDLFDVVFICEKYFDVLSSATVGLIENAFQYKDLSQLDYLLKTQDDSLINKDLLETRFLQAYEKVGLLADSKTIKTRIESASISEDIKAPSRSDGRNIGNKSLDREER